MLSRFRVAKYRFMLRALEDTRLPRYKGGMLRGGFGHVFKRAVCVHRDWRTRACGDCLLRSRCAYAYIFETLPPDDIEITEKLSDAPRPFVLEPPLERRTDYRAGDVLSFGLVLVGQGIIYLPYFIAVFQALGEAGLGRERGRFQLQEVEVVHPLRGEGGLLYRSGEDFVLDRDLSLGYEEVEAAAGAMFQERLSLRFLTPMRLKYRGQYVSEPSFHVLFRNVVRRVSWLSYFHCGERWEADFPALVAAAEKVTTQHMATEWVDWGRTSTRQRRHMTLGGFIGEAEYKGDLAPFLPLILLGSLVHVGKACTFGHGWYEVASQRVSESASR
ncbi:MAG: CRISPR system precrRNA processing endoribonuclease RAMP protein Cas6 [Anaerolineae bacterium]|nr:CRISPR system precrRNA processing endoribonuclease RAMP protein Cas6 [Anaerolineae bacterium]